MDLMNKKIQKKYSVIIFSLLFFFIFSSCDIRELLAIGSEDSGFHIGIRNYSIKEYNSCTFYMGYLNSTSNFIATDSLVYNNIVIHKKGDGNYYNAGEGYSSTDPFRNDKKGLNKYGYWEVDEVTILRESIDRRVYFKVNLEDKISVSSARAAFNGHVMLKILDNGDLSW
ncbi:MULTISPECIES: hypothetical protein [unclassified Polaribacter]|uniref:hypothetical protein n=1 Tax=unclassified Polaribacter TaxID=196858 RepID=UPI0011BD85E2|nr:MULTISPECIES: hypothetical protein [unclassified Polaribacter]TXD50761.1 hypothetical protein ES043_14760 [Polaribacter sp. IC063]TXD57455.1 hypothetical protein ES044_15010 [Polaribacter sp. IC066]